MNKIENTQGKIYYGIHFYPGVAEYQEPGADPYRVFLNENTLRSMDPTFAGKPIFVEHVDEVDPHLDELRKEADGWVIESFFNQADGKHWVKFIVVSEKGDRAIQAGLKLSNAYVPNGFTQGGLWNGVTYSKEIISGEYEHLAIVKHPRYEESIILTPEEFKKYNEEKVNELKKLSNSKQGEAQMKLNFFKRSKVENTIDPELCVILPKSGKEMTITQLVNDADMKEADKNSGLADMSHKVKMHDGSYCNVGELLEKHKAMCDELATMKETKKDSEEKESDLSTEGEDVESESSPEMKDDMGEDSSGSLEDSEDDEEAKKKALQLAEHEEKEIQAAKKKNEAKVKAERLKNANLRSNILENEAPTLEMSADRVARGRARYGS